jgi:hypothetical protein
MALGVFVEEWQVTSEAVCATVSITEMRTDISSDM